MTDLHDAYADLRHATRVVWAYQRRVLDVLQVIRDAIPEMERYELHIGQYEEPHKALSINYGPGWWAWDTMPFVDMAFHHLERDRADNWVSTRGTWLIEVRFWADTGYSWAPGREPDPSKFDPIEECQSRLMLTMLKGTDRPEVKAWRDTLAGAHIGRQNGSELELDEWITGAVRHVHNLEDINDADVLSALIRDFTTACRDKLDVEIGPQADQGEPLA